MSDYHDYPRRYVGARYVPQFADPIKWDPNRSYEALTIVDYGDNRYTSKIPVPEGVDIANTVYWVLTGASNDKLDHYIVEAEGYREEVGEYNKTVDEYKEAVEGYHEEVNVYHNEVNNLTNVVNDNTTAVNEYKGLVDMYQNTAEAYRDDVDNYRQEVGEYKQNVEGYHEELDAFMSSVDERFADMGGDYTWYDLKNKLPFKELGGVLNALITEGYNAFILPAGEYTILNRVGMPEHFALVGVGRPTITRVGTEADFSVINGSVSLDGILFKGINFYGIETELPVFLYAAGGKNIIIEDCNFKNGHSVVDCGSSSNVTIRRCGFSDNVTEHGILRCNDVNNLHVENCLFVSNGGMNCYIFGYNIFVHGNIVRGGGDTSSSGLINGFTVGGSNINVCNNVFANINNCCLGVTNPSYGVIVNGNYFGSSDCGVGLYNGERLKDDKNVYASICNNVFNGNRAFDGKKYNLHGDICVLDCKYDNIVVTGNTSRKGVAEGYITDYLVYFSDDVDVENSMITGNNVIGLNYGVTNYNPSEEGTTLVANNNYH